MSKLNDYTLRSNIRRAVLNVTFVQPDVSDECTEPQAPVSDVVITKRKRNSLFKANDAEQQNVEEANGGFQADTSQGSSTIEVNKIKVSYFVGAGDKREHGLSKTKWKGDECTPQSVMLDPYVPGYVRVQSGPSSEEGNITPWSNTGDVNLDPQLRATSGKSMGDGFGAIPNRSSTDPVYDTSRSNFLNIARDSGTKNKPRSDDTNNNTNKPPVLTSIMGNSLNLAHEMQGLARR